MLPSSPQPGSLLADATRPQGLPLTSLPQLVLGSVSRDPAHLGRCRVRRASSYKLGLGGLAGVTWGRCPRRLQDTSTLQELSSLPQEVLSSGFLASLNRSQLLRAVVERPWHPASDATW